MTQEEKAYDEANYNNYKSFNELIERLESVKDAIKKQNYGIAMDILCNPYPEFQITTSTELKESDDRIRKALIDEYEDKLDRCACESFNKGYKAAIEHQKEKHAEWSKEDMDIINGIIMDYEGEIEHLSDSAIDEQAKPIYQERINFLNRLKSLYPVRQEWSEEDDNKINSIKYLLHELDNHNFDNWLKSLKDRVQLQNTVTDEELAQAKKDAYNDALDKIEYHSGEPTFDDGWDAAIWYLKKRNIQSQSKQKWSKEDERCLTNAIYACMDESDEDYDYSQSYIDVINWLKSLKQKYNWKPSDEQLTWLYRAVDISDKDSRMKQVLNELLEQLKKLKDE